MLANSHDGVAATVATATFPATLLLCYCYTALLTPYTAPVTVTWVCGLILDEILFVAGTEK